METTAEQFITDLEELCRAKGVIITPEGKDYVIHDWGNNTSRHEYCFNFSVPIRIEK